MHLKSSKIFVKCAADFQRLAGIWSNLHPAVTKATIASSDYKYDFKHNNL